MPFSPSSRNCNNIPPFLQNPRKRKLRRGALSSLCNIFKSTDEHQILLEIAWLESR